LVEANGNELSTQSSAAGKKHFYIKIYRILRKTCCINQF